ncbi:MAG: efflux RND transporter permease subunit [Candidatus Eiseniibacteriota bacterium]
MISAVVAFAVRRRVTVLMVALAVIAFGGVGFSRLPLDLLPDISYPSITIQTEFPDTAPGEVETLVTRPVEEAVGVLRGLQEIHSVTRAERSEVTLQFDWGADMDDLSLEVREKLDRLEFPEEVQAPVVLRYDPALDPIIRLALTGPDDLRLLRRVAEKEVKEDLETREGVAAAVVKGGEEEEIQIEVDQGKLSAIGITPETLGEILATSNINRPGGSLESVENRYLVRTLNEFDSLDEIRELPVNPPGTPPVRLADVATVTWGVKEREEITRVDGRESVEIAVYKEGDANTVAVADAVAEALEWLGEELPKGMELTVLFDQSRFIRQSIDEVQSALWIGGGLAILVLYLFLRSIRPTLIIATSIPLSILFTFMLMYRLDVSLNIMSLGGLTLGIGMLVDASIVVLESIHRRRQEGLPLAKAAIEGTAEVGGAVAATVLTTVAVFFPIVFVEGIAGQLFRDQALTVTFSLLASMVVAVTIIPMFSSIGDANVGTEPSRRKSRPAKSEKATLGRLSQRYERVIRGALARPGLTLTIAGVLFLASLAVIPTLGTELIPVLTEGEFYFEAVLPEGTPLAATDRVIARMDEAARAEPAVEQTFATIGSRLVSGGLALKTRDENLGQLNLVVGDRSDETQELAIADRLREQFSRIPNLVTKLGRPSFFSLKTPVELVFYGENLEELRDYTLGLLPAVREVPGLVDVRASLESGNPELTVQFDRDRLAALGLSIADVSSGLHDRVNGTVVSRFREEDRDIDIRLRNREQDRDTVGDIENLVVAERDGVPVTLAAVADITPARGPAEIHRIQQSRAAIVTGEVAGRSVGAVNEDLEALVLANRPPASITWELAGQNREMERSFASLRFALLLAIFLVYLVMAATFENLVHPFIILFTIPLALVGVVLGLVVGGFTLSVIAMLGAILLAGVVVDNAIILVDAINRFRRDGVDKREAIVAACHVRLRPILMTTLTTILGLVPMAIGFGEGAELRQPLAVVVIFGLAVGTALTLLVIPAAYLVVPTSVAVEHEEDAPEPGRIPRVTGGEPLPERAT